MSSTKRLQGKVAVVTGGNSGIGLATAKRLQEEGARVAISGRNKKTLDEAVKTISNGVLAVQADVSKLSEVDKLYSEVSKKLGGIDVLFVNAGVAKFAPLAETPESLFDEQFDTNIKGAYFTVQKAIPFLNDGASIILNTSVADRKGTTGAPILIDALGAVECRVASIVEQGDHHIVVGEVIDDLSKPPTGRPDSAILEMKDLGENVFYGG